jgi:hypothetical protein
MVAVPGIGYAEGRAGTNYRRPGESAAKEDSGLMRPLLFVNWRSVHRAFCGVMWVIAVVLAVVVLVHVGLPAESGHHAAHVVR